MLHEPYAYLYVGDYFADTLDLSVREHRALRLLLLETWVRGPVGNVRLAQAAGLTRAEWQEVKPAVLPLLRAVQPHIAQCLRNIRAFDGQRLPAMTGTSSAAPECPRVPLIQDIRTVPEPQGNCDFPNKHHGQECPPRGSPPRQGTCVLPVQNPL
jgi:hypothetical protein